MQQAPKYLIIGSGLMASHFCYYLRLLHLPYHQWSRKKNTTADLREYSESCTHILLLISDLAIENFIETHPFLLAKRCMHFSGGLAAQKIFSAHPLMTFSANLYDLDTYRHIPFVLEQEGPSLAELLPGLPNREFKIPKSSKPLYHALIVMGNNFTTILWQYVFQKLKHDFHLPQEIANPILQQTMNNLLDHPKEALTGPLARNDNATIAAHLKALENDPYQEIYQAFINVYAKSKRRS